MILTGRNAERLQRAASELGALSTAAFDAADPAALEQFFRDLPTPIDHVMVTAGPPHYGRLLDMDFAQARRALGEHLLLALRVARNAVRKVRPGGTLLLMGGTGGRRAGHRPRDRIGRHRRTARPDRQPRARARARPRQPHRRRLRRHAVVGIAPRRSARGPPQSASRHASHPARRRTGRRRRARRAHHDQHGPHRRDLRHRRRTAVRHGLARVFHFPQSRASHGHVTRSARVCGCGLFQPGAPNPSEHGGVEKERRRRPHADRPASSMAVVSVIGITSVLWADAHSHRLPAR